MAEIESPADMIQAMEKRIKELISYELGQLEGRVQVRLEEIQAQVSAYKGAASATAKDLLVLERRVEEEVSKAMQEIYVTCSTLQGTLTEHHIALENAGANTKNLQASHTNISQQVTSLLSEMDRKRSRDLQYAHAPLTAPTLPGGALAHRDPTPYQANPGVALAPPGPTTLQTTSQRPSGALGPLRATTQQTSTLLPRNLDGSPMQTYTTAPWASSPSAAARG